MIIENKTTIKISKDSRRKLKKLSADLDLHYDQLIEYLINSYKKEA